MNITPADIFYSTPILPPEFFSPQYVPADFPIVYGYGGCSSLGVSPRPICKPYYPPTTNIPADPWEPVDPPTSVPVPGTAFLLAFGLCLLIGLICGRAARG